MNAILSANEFGRLRQAALLGFARQPLMIPEPLQPLVAAAAPERDAILTVLALAGQQVRFQRPAIERRADAIPDAAQRLHDDPRSVMPEQARRALMRLANGVDKGNADAVLSAAVRRVTRAGFRLHPFDLPRLISHIRNDVRCLGLAERAYLTLTDSGSAGATPSLLDAEITPANWTTFPKGHRVAFLREARREDPAQARRLLEEVFLAEPALVRADLLAALEVRLGLDDLPFIEGVVADRAESVRSIAARLIACVPGTPAFTARLAEAARCFARSGSSVTGILRRVGLTGSRAVVFTPPPSANRDAQMATLAQLFNGFSAAEIGTAVGLTASEVIDALPVDEGVIYTAFFDRAARDGDNAMMERLIEARLQNATARPYSMAPLLAWLANNLTAPASANFGKALINSSALQEALQRLREATTPAAMKDDGTLVWTVALLPPELVTAFVETMAPLPPATARSARDFTDLVLALAAAPTPQG